MSMDSKAHRQSSTVLLAGVVDVPAVNVPNGKATESVAFEVFVRTWLKPVAVKHNVVSPAPRYFVVSITTLIKQFVFQYVSYCFCAFSLRAESRL